MAWQRFGLSTSFTVETPFYNFGTRVDIINGSSMTATKRRGFEEWRSYGNRVTGFRKRGHVELDSVAY